ncbi:o-succinylbenzoate synthase [Zunongwangia atlantica]|uniref:O-succinylbenzoate synthase n=1 Tax=Zunongwangia atlantica 22II14-10F7 TaxID=1185767 RepID=A0A1Y1TAX9_9FLAO|nr:o-succinylbenzoate synthase [Zunongwangia atlantica]ORL47533.1 O-succinylbenzoate synthase [Zunongwangia atlantica 22II14-10F7]
MQATYKQHILNFKRPSGTSRGVLTVKETWFIKIEDGDNFGYGECGILRGLSIDDRADYEEKLKWACENIQLGKDALWEQLMEFPSIQFGIEMAFKSLENENEFELFPSAFTKGEEAIAINGLIWMGEKDFMKSQIEDKLKSGFNCIKMKIGAIDFDTEIELLKYIRSQYSAEEIELRVDANGAFDPKNALEKLKHLSELQLHSIEQPIKQGNWEEMARLCAETPLPIALDEELIGVFDVTKKKKLLQTIQPQYLIFKPSLIGGFKGTQQWIDVAETNNIGWWNTSALESNIGLNAISQFTYEKKVKMPQGLGTGSLYTNNMESPLEVKNGQISYNPGLNWDFKF